MSRLTMLDFRTGPYIIYMLNEMDILEDWAAIRKVGESFPFVIITCHVVCVLCVLIVMHSQQLICLLLCLCRVILIEKVHQRAT